MSIDSLNSDLLIYLFNFLPTKQLFKIESVNKKWQKCVRKLMDKRITELKISDQLYRNFIKKVENNNIFYGFRKSYYVMNDTNIVVIKNILLRCQSVKYLDLRSCKITSKGNNLIEVAKLLPKLERICLADATIQVPHNKWNQFTKLIGPKLIECNVMLDKSSNNFNLLKALFKEFKNIEKLEFDSRKNDQELFAFLNSCDLRHLKWNNYVYNYAYENLINFEKTIFQRLNYLRCTLHTFTQFNCKMDNLIELEIWSWNIDEQINIQYKQMDQIEFPNLKRLTIDLEVGEMKLFSKLNFPNLEYLFVQQFQGYLPENEIIFFNLFKKCKEIEFNLFKLTEQLYKFTNLTKLKLTCFGMSHEEKSKSLDIITNHKQLEQIIIENISFNFRDIDEYTDIFDRINNLKNKKPNAEISVSIFFYIELFAENFYETIDEYKKSFERTKWKVQSIKCIGSYAFNLKS